jgi:hypothetical protein
MLLIEDRHPEVTGHRTNGSKGFTTMKSAVAAGMFFAVSLTGTIALPHGADAAPVSKSITCVWDGTSTKCTASNSTTTKTNIRHVSLVCYFSPGSTGDNILLATQLNFKVAGYGSSLALPMSKPVADPALRYMSNASIATDIVVDAGTLTLEVNSKFTSAKGMKGCTAYVIGNSL